MPNQKDSENKMPDYLARRRSEDLAKAFQVVNDGLYFPHLMAHVAKAFVTQALHEQIVNADLRRTEIEMEDYIHDCHLVLDLLADTYQANLVGLKEEGGGEINKLKKSA